MGSIIYIPFGFYVMGFLFINATVAIEDYCAKNTYNDSDSLMHFSKEATFEEFAVVGKFKGLHCCAKGYRSIEWYKDDKLYPWPLHMSRLILFPESANQTIYTKSVTAHDAGNYTCVLKNDTVIHSHTIYLKVFEKVPDDPKMTYISQDTEISTGQSLRLFCEAFAGQVDLPDAHSEAHWRKVGENGTIYEVPPHVEQLKINREDGQTFGTYLLIHAVKREDFGQYVCIISKPGNTIQRYVYVAETMDEVEYLNPNPIPVGKMILLLSVILFSSLALVVLYLQYGVKVQVRFKDAFGTLEENDGRCNDLLIVYSPQDTEIAVGVLMPTLHERYGYSCSAKELDKNITSWYSDLKTEAQNYRRIVVVLSPTLLSGNWDSNSILLALKQLKSLGPTLICVALKQLPKNEVEVKTPQGETLKSVTSSVGLILWQRQDDEKFWYSLRLRLPPKRRTDNIETRSNSSMQSENIVRLTENFENV